MFPTLTASSGIEEATDRFLDYLTDDRKFAANTLTAYRCDLHQFTRYLLPRLADIRLPVASVQRQTILEFMAELEATGLKPATRTRKLASVRAFFRYLCREGVVPSNPAAGLPVPETEFSLPNTIELADFERAILLPPSDDFRGARDRAIMELFYGGGIRLRELVGLNLSALEDSDGTVRVSTGRFERIVPVGEPAHKALGHYLLQRTDLVVGLEITQVDAGALFLNTSGKRLHVRTVQRIVNRYLGAVVEANGFSPQVLRHSFTRHMLDAGADPTSVKELLGHGTLGATKRYARPDPDRLQQIYANAHPRA